MPAITALGVGGLAVALAFQDTLANVLSGLNLTLSRQIRKLAEALVVDEMRLAAEVLPGLRKDVPAAVRFKAFGEWALDFRVYVEIASFQDRMYLRHELMMRLHDRLLREDIALPRQRILIDAPTATPA